MALEELAEAEERLLFLTVQRQDIVEGIAATEEALREIKRRSRERFRQAFEQINRNFSVLFQELFGGGRGEMSLIDADDVLESGIDVVAQPPGKRLQNVLLLSGGEKAMAALAWCLEFSIIGPLHSVYWTRSTLHLTKRTWDALLIRSSRCLPIRNSS